MREWYLEVSRPRQGAHQANGRIGTGSATWVLHNKASTERPRKWLSRRSTQQHPWPDAAAFICVVSVLAATSGCFCDVDEQCAQRVRISRLLTG